VRKALAGIEKGIDVLEARQEQLRPATAAPADADDHSRDLDEWPDAAANGQPSPNEEDAGQTVPR